MVYEGRVYEGRAFFVSFLTMLRKRHVPDVHCGCSADSAGQIVALKWKPDKSLSVILCAVKVL